MRNHWTYIIFTAVIAAVFLPAMPLLAAVESAAQAQTLPPGVAQLEDFRYPVYVFEPQGFKKSRQPAALIVIGDAPEKTIQAWMPAAAKKNLLVVSPEMRLRDDDVSTNSDDRLLNLKKEIWLRYKVKRFFLAGEDMKAHYAAYFGLKYPDAFDSVGAIGASWVGPFEKLVRYSDKPKNQAPFFIVIKDKDPLFLDIQQRAEELRSKGYEFRLVVLDKKGEEKSPALKNDLLQWMMGRQVVAEMVAAKTAAQKSPPQRPWKAKFSKVVEEFFAV